MPGPASRLFVFLGVTVLACLLFPVQASAQLIQPNVVLYDDQGSGLGSGLGLDGDRLALGAPSNGTVSIHERNQEGANHWGRVALANNSIYLDQTGSDVDLSGDLLAAAKVGHPAYPSDPGAARIFERNRGGANFWGLVLTLTPSDPMDARPFGSSVAISGDTVAVGVGTFSSDLPFVGSVYIFERNQGGADHWGQVRKVTLPSLAGSAVSVDLEGDTLVVGTFRDGGLGTDAGAVYVFGRNQGGTEQWGQVQKLTASDGAADRWFGYSVEISGGTIVVGAPGIPGLPGPRAAYIFEGGQGAWSEARKLPSPNAISLFGLTVAIDGDVVVVSAILINGSSGSSAYVYRRNLGGADQWGQAGRLAARSDLSTIAVRGNVAVLGNSGSGELFGPEVYVFDLAPLLITGDIPTLSSVGLALMALLLLAAGWRVLKPAPRRRSS